jgi:hypothetical protein
MDPPGLTSSPAKAGAQLHCLLGWAPAFAGEQTR